MFSRRSMMLAGLGTGLGAGLGAGGALANQPARDKAVFNNPDMPLMVDIDREPDEIMPIWPDEPPGGVPDGLQDELQERDGGGGLRDRALRRIARPYLAVFRAGEPDGSALMLMPGGGYTYVVVDKEGYEGARWISRRGMSVFVLFYRLPGTDQGGGWAGGADTPLQDAQRAMRVIRHRAGTYGIEPDKLAAMGYSAGGHLSGSLATRFDARVYEPVDEADALSARPDLSATIYPVITLSEPHTHRGSRDQLIGKDAPPERVAAYSVENTVSGDTPPLFIIHTTDDPAVPVENSLMLYAAARKAGVPADLHIFPEGGHGYGFRIGADKSASAWPNLFDRWRRLHFFAG